MNTKTKNAVLKKAIDIKATILAIPKGESRMIKTRDAKTNVVRSCVSRLNAEGYSFGTSEKGLVDEIKVTRFK